MRNKLIAILTALAACGAVGVAVAHATEYAHHVEVKSGTSYFGPYVLLDASEAYSYGSALPCAGVSGVGMTCASTEGEVVGLELPYNVESEPYIHDHSSWNSYFSGSYYKS